MKGAKRKKIFFSKKKKKSHSGKFGYFGSKTICPHNFGFFLRFFSILHDRGQEVHLLSIEKKS